MKLLIMGDFHLRFKKPAMRLDENYFQTQRGKVEWILNLAGATNCNFILQPGDFFDGVDVPDFVKQSYIRLFKEKNIPILTVAGQHDMRYHSRRLETTPISVMEASGVVQILGRKDWLGKGKPIIFYGASWGEEIPEIKDKEKINILLTHRMVIDNEKLWFGQENYTTAKQLLKDYDFDLIVTGDNHQSFICENNQRYVVNCGSLMRANIDQAKHKPVVYVYDTETRELEKHFIPVEPAKKVLDLSKAELIKTRDSKLEKFVDSLA